MSRLANQYLTYLTNRRVEQRDRLIRQHGRQITRWARSVEVRLLGIIHADRGGTEGVMGSVDAFLIGLAADAAEAMFAVLADMWDWSWDSAVDMMVRAVPMETWVGRMAPLGVGEQISDSDSLRREHLNKIAEAGIKGSEAGRRLRDTIDDWAAATETLSNGVISSEQARNELRGFLGRLMDPSRLMNPIPLQEVVFDPEVELAGILNGTATAAEARAMVARFEFPAPTPDRVDAILRATNAPDGLDAMTRIKTVMPQDLDRLRSTIVSALTDPDRASAIQGLTPRIRDMVGGIHYKAQRIARTESMRIAEAGQNECDSQVDDMITGYMAMTADDVNVRRTHWVWHKQIYKRIAQGRYWHATLHELPQFPAGPNCRCFKVAQLATDLTRGLPPVQLGGQYGRALARFKAQGLAQ